MDKDRLKRILQALLFSSDSPLTTAQIRTIFPELDKTQIDEALFEIENEYQAQPFFLKKVGGGFQFATQAEFAKYIEKMYDTKSSTRLSRAALETLAIIAFKQPISRVEVSAIRGVNSDGVIKSLLEKRLITMSGRDTGPGRALLFNTTNEFLQYFGINSLADLPRPKEIEELLAEGEGAQILLEIPNQLESRQSGENDPEESIKSAARDEETE